MKRTVLIMLTLLLILICGVVGCNKKKEIPPYQGFTTNTFYYPPITSFIFNSQEEIEKEEVAVTEGQVTKQTTVKEKIKAATTPTSQKIRTTFVDPYTIPIGYDIIDYFEITEESCTAPPTIIAETDTTVVVETDTTSAAEQDNFEIVDITTEDIENSF